MADVLASVLTRGLVKPRGNPRVDQAEDIATGGSGALRTEEYAPEPMTPTQGGPSMRTPTLDPLRNLSPQARARFGRGLPKP